MEGVDGGVDALEQMGNRMITHSLHGKMTVG
jgi:hypothetical protein